MIRWARSGVAVRETDSGTDSSSRRIPRWRWLEGGGAPWLCLGVLCGTAAVQMLAWLPARPWGWGVMAGAAALAGALMVASKRRLAEPARERGRRRLALLMIVPIASWGWSVEQAHRRLAERMAADLEGRALEVRGHVEGLPSLRGDSVRFVFSIDQCMEEIVGCPRSLRARLGWRGEAAGLLRPGQCWQLRLRLRRPHSVFNRDLFDAERRALQEGIGAVGSVREGNGNQRCADDAWNPPAAIDRLRDHVRSRLRQALRTQPEAVTSLLVALAVGDQAAIEPAQWERFNRTGIGHLVSISGLHITMLSAGMALLVTSLWRRRWLARLLGRPAPAWIPTPLAAWGAAVATGFAYSALAGWGIPAQRTCWMLAIAGTAGLCGRLRQIPAVLSVAMMLVMLHDPWSVLDAGFWLSFGAVAAISFAGSRRPLSKPDRRSMAGPASDAIPDPDPAPISRRSAWPCRFRAMSRQAGATLIEAGATQWAVTLALLPLGAMFFFSVSLVSPLANALAIPCVSMAITPLVLLGAFGEVFLQGLGAWPLAIASWLAAGLLDALEALDRGRAIIQVLAAPGALVLLAAIWACRWLLNPWPLPGRGWAMAGLLPLWVGTRGEPPADHLRISALDVGQGMSVLVETSGRRLLYDAGPASPDGYDAGARWVVPWLRSRGIDHLDLLVLSHGDSDHAGGASAVLAGMKVDRMVSSLADDHPLRARVADHRSCRAGEVEPWGEEARLRWFSPTPLELAAPKISSNARSCVLQVVAGGRSLLLAGDIDKAVERRMLANSPAGELRSDVLIAPHHGSRSSSSPAFVQAVAPRVVVFQAGYRNRYHHPHPEVVARYRGTVSRVLRNDWHGGIEIELSPERISIRCDRIERPRYWRVTGLASEQRVDCLPRAGLE